MGLHSYLKPAPPDVSAAVKALADELGIPEAMRRVGVSRTALLALASGQSVHIGTLWAARAHLGLMSDGEIATLRTAGYHELADLAGTASKAKSGPTER